MNSAKPTVFKTRLCIYNLFSHRRQAHLCFKQETLQNFFYHPYNNALWRHILTVYDFYSSVNWNNLVTTLMQKFKKLFCPIMPDIIALCPVDYNLQYSLSAIRWARKKNSIFTCFSNYATPHAQHGRFLLMRDKLSNIFCA